MPRLPLLFALAALVIQGQESGRRPSPKIGLALSGGSALGLAHIGVIQWLERHRIPIDYIAGTSMGSLVGGLYATGHDGREIEEFVKSLDWRAALAPSVSYRDLAFRRKEDRRDYPSTLEFGVGKGLKLPTGVSAGHGAGLMISRFAAPYDQLPSFDDLPTPFRCVATDLKRGREVIFERGSLSQALRASMSLPALFAPVQQDGMLLVDGGLLNNLPVDVVKKMGADIVIAVALDKPFAQEQFSSLLAVAGRSISVMVAANERRSMGLADLVIMPDLNGLDGSDYYKAGEFIERGQAAAQQKAAMLAHLGVPDAEYAQYLARRRGRRQPAAVRPQLIVVEGGLARKRREALVAALASGPAKPIDIGRLERELDTIAGMGRYDAASYSFLRAGGTEGIIIRPHPKPHGPPFLNIALLLDASRQEGFRFGIGGRLTFLDLGGPASEWRSDLSIGQTNRISSEYYYRVRGGKWFAAPRLFYLEDSRPLYQGREQIADFITWQAGGAFDLGYAASRFQELRAGYALSHNRIGVAKGSTLLDPLEGRYSDVHLRWGYEGQNTALVPTAGLRAAVSASWLLDYPGTRPGKPLADASFSYARPFSSRCSLLTRFAGGGTARQEALNTYFALGGAGRLDALGRGREAGNRYYYGGIHVLRSLNSQSLNIFGRFYFFAAAETGNAWRAGTSVLPRYSGSLGLIGETAFGVVYLGGGAGDRGDHRIFFRLGRVF